jgi:anti-sigma B factor antagonist
MSFFYIIDGVTPEGVDPARIALLVAGGEIDFEAAPQLKERIFDQIEDGGRCLLLDLSMVTFIDSTAIGVLVGASTKAQDTGESSLVVVCEEENNRVQRILDIAGVANILTVLPSRERAFAELASTG